MALSLAARATSPAIAGRVTDSTVARRMVDRQSSITGMPTIGPMIEAMQRVLTITKATDAIRAAARFRVLATGVRSISARSKYSHPPTAVAVTKVAMLVSDLSGSRRARMESMI